MRDITMRLLSVQILAMWVVQFYLITMFTAQQRQRVLLKQMIVLQQAQLHPCHQHNPLHVAVIVQELLLDMEVTDTQSVLDGVVVLETNGNVTLAV